MTWLYLLPAGILLLLLALAAGAIGQRHLIVRMTGMTLAELVADVKAAALQKLQAVEAEVARLLPVEQELEAAKAEVARLAPMEQELKDAQAALEAFKSEVEPAPAQPAPAPEAAPAEQPAA